MPQMTLTAEIQPEQMGQRLDQTLAELFPEYSRSRLKTWIEAKQVKMNGEIADIPRAKVYGGEQIEISVEVEDENRFEPQNIPLNIVYEDDDIIVINKPISSSTLVQAIRMARYLTRYSITIHLLPKYRAQELCIV